MLSSIAPGAHVVQFYEAEQSLYETIARFVADAWRQSSPAILICRQRTFDAVLEQLANDHDVTDPLKPLLFVEAGGALESLLQHGTPDRARFESLFRSLEASVATNQNDRPVWIYGEMVDVLCQQGRHEAAITLERLWNQVRAGSRFTVLCGYSLASFDRDAEGRDFRAVCDAHTHVLPAEVFAGDADTRAQLERIACLQQRARVRPEMAMANTSPPPLAKDSIVYIVDDDAGMRRSLARLLTSMDVAVETFPSAEAFLARVHHTAAGCLLLDMHLEGMSGIDLQRRMAMEGWTMPVIAMSGLDDERMEDTARGLGARLVLQKPFNLNVLFEAIARTSP